MLPALPTAAFRAARDSLLHATAREASAFRWPDIGEEFNWAADWFDVIAAGNDRLAL